MQSIAAQESNAEQTNYDGDILEIEVTGREQIRVLKKQVSMAQDRVHEIFNEFNDDPEFDISCERRASIGTRIAQKECAPNYFHAALEDDGEAGLGMLQGSNSTVHYSPVSTVLMHKGPILKEKMAALMQENPDFKQAITRHQELTEELNERLNVFFESK